MKHFMTILFIMFSMIACNGEVSENKEKGAGYFVTKDPHFIDTLQIDKLIESLPEKYTKQIIFKANWGNGEGEYWEAGDSPKVGPGNVYVDEKGQIYIWDVGNKRIAQYNSQGDLITTYMGFQFGSKYRMFLRNDSLYVGQYILNTKSGSIIQNKWEDSKKFFTSVTGRGHNDTKWFDSNDMWAENFGLYEYSMLAEEKRNEEFLKSTRKNYENANTESFFLFLDKDFKENIYLLGNFTIRSGTSFLFKKHVIFKYSHENELISIIDISEAKFNVLWGEPRILNYFIDENGDIYALIPAIEGEGKGLKGKTGIILIKYSLTK
ncbi:MAG: hypothetical protein PHW02_03045 [bacterium]|nr:hypothetical protein [bacterium]